MILYPKGGAINLQLSGYFLAYWFVTSMIVQKVPSIPELTDTQNSRNMERRRRKKGTPPPRSDEAFKTGAIRMVTEQGRQPAEVARDLGICIDTTVLYFLERIGYIYIVKILLHGRAHL